uniref:VWFA domain-containing protein n=1 Tax=Strongyloides venezuelensis TaxID=75913 RepID=A0A0K0FBS2_STRVS
MNVIFKNIFFLLSISYVTQLYKIQLTEEKGESVIPCNRTNLCYISIVFDISSDILSNELFVDMKNILKNNISTEIPNFTQVSFTTFSRDINTILNFGNFKNKDDFLEFVESLKQSPGFILSNVLNTVNNLATPSTTKLSTFVIISNYDKEEIANSIVYANKLRQKGSLNFVILGRGIKPVQLLSLEPSSIYAINFDNNDTKQLTAFFYNSLSCFPENCIR